jgi:NADP-dependent 3-hydroxy acid dehydrogenase YdfG
LLTRAPAATVKRMTTDTPLTGRVAVVTGATSGIGAATARRLTEGGAAVAVLGRRANRLSGTLRVQVDISDSYALERAAETIRAELGPVDIVVANAGAMLAAPFESAPTDEWDRMLDVNVRGLLRTGRAFADDLIAAATDGRAADLVHVGSIGAHEVFPNYAVYGATKAAVAHVTRNLRAELGPRGVRVRTIEPGLVSTELGDDMADAGNREALDEMRAQIGPLPPENVAEAIAFTVAVPPRVIIAELVVLPTAQG